ncbi:MAG: SAM-dependent methyltransferase [Candidatus Pacearchaeota archaeon]|jgi:23S rRNA (cytidine1920-2'-O)/16S rRNA (cytidine1409-2'-O)-methyltransferase
MQPVSRGYHKLKFAIEKFKLNLKNKVCADFGSSTGGFVQAILEEGPEKIYSIETSKNRLHFALKDDERVIVLDKTNAIHIKLPEKCDFISIDAGWTIQKKILPNAIKNLKDNGEIVSLIKPHYEANEKIRNEEHLQEILEKVKKEISGIVDIVNIVESPLVGKKGGNREFLILCKKKS